MTIKMNSQYPRVIGLFDATLLVVGNMIGSGIFLLAGYAASGVTSGWMLLFAWGVGGVMALLGALCIAELATRFPSGGGDFLYLFRVYGSYPAFLYGWMSLVISFTGAIAVLAIFSAKYLLELIPDLIIPFNYLSVILIILFTAVHCLKTAVGTKFQSALVILKGGGICLLALLLYQRSSTISPFDFSSVDIHHSIPGFARALVPIFFAYSGWNVAGYLAGEVSNPRKTLPMAFLGGTFITTVLYLLLNGAYVNALGLDSMRGESMVPLTALKLSGYEGWIKFLSALIFVSIVSSLSITIQSGARIIQSMGEHGLFIKTFGKLHPRLRTPVRALVIQGIGAALLLFLLDIETLVDSTTVVMVLFSALTISALIKVRGLSKSHSQHNDNHFTCPFYPIIPVAYMGSAIFISWGVVQFYVEQGSLLPMWGTAFLVSGTILYWLWRKWKFDSAGRE